MTLDGTFARLATLTTDRSIIREARLSDAEALFAVRSDPEVTMQYGQEPNRSVEDTQKWIMSSLDHYARREAMTGVLMLKNEGAAIGECCFWNFGKDHHCAEIGYELHPSYW